MDNFTIKNKEEVDRFLNRAGRFRGANAIKGSPPEGVVHSDGSPYQGEVNVGWTCIATGKTIDIIYEKDEPLVVDGDYDATHPAPPEEGRGASKKTKGRPRRYDFSPVLDGLEVVLSGNVPSIRVSARIWAKKNGVKIRTKTVKVDGKAVSISIKKKECSPV